MTDSTTPIDARWVRVEEIIPLRHEVLRAGLPREAAIFPGDELHTSRHAGIFDPAGACIACGSIHLNPYDGSVAYQVRGMAVRADWQGRGLGSTVLRMLEEMAGSRDVPLMWANARVPAVDFYRRHGWEVVSEPFDIPTAGPHVVMRRRLK